MKCCSACASTTYCSVHCQKTHWKEHKPECRKSQKLNSSLFAPALFQEWKEKVKANSILELILSYYSQTHGGLSRAHVVIVQVDFDYNARTFTFVGPPTKMLIETIDDSKYGDGLAEKIQGSLQENESDDARAIIIEYGGALVIMSRSINHEMFKLSWEEDICRGTEQILLSSIPTTSLETWKEMTMQNLQEQLNVLENHKSFDSFLSDALRAASTKPRHKTHMVVIRFDLGRGLGEIASLSGFQVVTLEEGWDLYSLRYASKDGNELEEDKTIFFGFNESFERQAEVSFYFLNEKHKISLIHKRLLNLPSHKKRATQCYEDAARSFKTLQGVTLPQVKLPPLP